MPDAHPLIVTRRGWTRRDWTLHLRTFEDLRREDAKVRERLVALALAVWHSSLWDGDWPRDTPCRARSAE